MLQLLVNGLPVRFRRDFEDGKVLTTFVAQAVVKAGQRGEVHDVDA